MAGICNIYEEMEQHLERTDVEEIKYLLQDTPVLSKLYNCIVLNFDGFVFTDTFLKIYKS